MHERSFTNEREDFETNVEVIWEQFSYLLSF